MHWMAGSTQPGVSHSRKMIQTKAMLARTTIKILGLLMGGLTEVTTEETVEIFPKENPDAKGCWDNSTMYCRIIWNGDQSGFLGCGASPELTIRPLQYKTGNLTMTFRPLSPLELNEWWHQQQADPYWCKAWRGGNVFPNLFRWIGKCKKGLLDTNYAYAFYREDEDLAPVPTMVGPTAVTINLLSTRTATSSPADTPTLPTPIDTQGGYLHRRFETCQKVLQSSPLINFTLYIWYDTPDNTRACQNVYPGLKVSKHHRKWGLVEGVLGGVGTGMGILNVADIETLQNKIQKVGTKVGEGIRIRNAWGNSAGGDRIGILGPNANMDPYRSTDG
ncbi:uncharacterized protein [Narcine bancroftii]|uniref:uncharacterized protein isoform X2 n=1 Tax=Narcine bancroftii TaxID=1343680 RepID=UPI003831DBAF